MKKILLFIFCLICFTAFSAESAQFHLDWTIQNSSWFYEPIYRMDNVSLNTALVTGLQFDWFTIGVDAFCDYVSLNGQDPDRLFQGAWINIGGTLNTFFALASWMEIKLGTGGLWQQSAFQYNNSGWLSLGLPAFSALLDIRFTPWPFLDIILKNRFDLVLFTDSNGAFSNFLPNYLGGIRVNLAPVKQLPWLIVFTEGTALYWNYTSDVRTLDTWMFQLQVGLSLNFLFGDNKTSRQRQDKVEIKLTTGDESRELIVEAAKNKMVKNEAQDPELIAFSKAEPGGIVTFTKIIFNKGEDTLVPESLLYLDKIADILKNNPEMQISISAYTEYYGNIVMEFELIKSRAKTITAYLIGKGVEESRVRANVTGQVLKSDKDIQSKVYFKIME